jgi:hypothetical protein
MVLQHCMASVGEDMAEQSSEKPTNARTSTTIRIGLLRSITRQTSLSLWPSQGVACCEHELLLRGSWNLGI